MALTRATGKQVTVKNSGTGSVVRNVQDKLEEFVSVKDFGAVGDGVTDDTAAIQAAIAYCLTTNKQIYYPAGTYLVTNFHKKAGAFHYGDYAQWKIGSTLIPIPLYNDTTWGDYTIYVDATSGSDSANCGLTAGTAYKTIQYAWDSIPTTVRNNVTIQLADGTYDTSSISAASQPRPSILWGKGKITTLRSTSTGSDVDAAIKITGNSSDATAVKIKCTSEYTYGVYINKGNVALTHLTIEGDGANTTSALLVAHRTDTYIHTKTIILDGVNKTTTTYGAYAESSGQIELTDSLVKRCKTGLGSLTGGDYVGFSAGSNYGIITDCTAGFVLAQGSGVVYSGMAGDTSMVNSCTRGIVAINGSSIEIRGSGTGNRPLIESTTNIESGSSLEATYAAFNSAVYLSSSSARVNTVDYQSPIIVRASQIWMSRTNSYVSPNTANDAARPLDLIYGSSAYYSGTNNFVGASGGYVAKNYNSQLSFSSNNQVLSTTPDTDNYNVTGGSANRLLCEISSVNVEEGRVIYVDGDSWNVQFNGAGTHMEFDTPFYLGASAGSYSGAIFKMRNGKWRLVALGEVRV